MIFQATPFNRGYWVLGQIPDPKSKLPKGPAPCSVSLYRRDLAIPRAWLEAATQGPRSKTRLLTSNVKGQRSAIICPLSWHKSTSRPLSCRMSSANYRVTCHRRVVCHVTSVSRATTDHTLAADRWQMLVGCGQSNADRGTLTSRIIILARSKIYWGLPFGCWLWRKFLKIKDIYGV